MRNEYISREEGKTGLKRLLGVPGQSSWREMMEAWMSV